MYNKKGDIVRFASYPNLEQLGNNVYQLKCDNSGNFYLNQVYDLSLPKKIYGSSEHKFVDRVIKTYNTLDKNIGVYLHGIKGTGKTICSKLIAIKSNQPIILVDNYYGNISDFFIQLKENATFIFDEYDKVYGSNNTLLGILDGVVKTNNKHLFVLTSNSKNISDYMIDRPNRIRYIKKYDNMSYDMIIEIIDDLLEVKARKEELIQNLKYYPLITSDILINIINEINIHNISPSEAIEYFNISPCTISEQYFFYKGVKYKFSKYGTLFLKDGNYFIINKDVIKYYNCDDVVLDVINKPEIHHVYDENKAFI